MELEHSLPIAEKTSQKIEETSSETKTLEEKPAESSEAPENLPTVPEVAPPPPPPPVQDIPTSKTHDYDTLSPVHKDTEVGKLGASSLNIQESSLNRQESSRTRQESGADDEDFADAEENFPETQTYSPVDEERKAGLEVEASLEELRQPTKIDGSSEEMKTQEVVAEEQETEESPTSTIVNKTTDEATLKLIGEYGDMDKLTKPEKSPELAKSMFEKIREFFDEPKEEEPDNYAPISITTSKCSVCQGVHKSGSSGSSPDDHDFSIYGPLTLDGSPDSTGSFCPICQSRAEHDLAVKSETHR